MSLCPIERKVRTSKGYNELKYVLNITAHVQSMAQGPIMAQCEIIYGPRRP